MAGQPHVGLLPLYLKLYDDRRPDMRNELMGFLQQVTDLLRAKGLQVTCTDVCRLQDEVGKAMDVLDAADVDLIATLHLAYSPSLEAAEHLVKSKRPILLLDTTMDYDFGPQVDPVRILYNHGIHGVQDLASVLRREGCPYEIVAGHVTVSDVLDRAADIARAASAARRLRTARVLRIGEAFRGMGDFAVDDRTMHKALGVHVDNGTAEVVAKAAADVLDSDVSAEMAEDAKRFHLRLDPEVHRRSVRAGLALRRVLDEGRYTGFSMNFLAFDSGDGPLNTVPFLEASKAMSRGIGYAGEGDTLTAALVGALASSFGRTTFTEIFCPDWKGNALFLSHMGEVNPDVAVYPPHLFEKDFPWTPALNPAVAAGTLAPGPAVLVNLAPGPNDTFSLIVAPGQLVTGQEHPGMLDWVRGWFEPELPLDLFLEEYSRAGGTHHSALVMGERREAIDAFAQYAGLQVTSLS